MQLLPFDAIKPTLNIPVFLGIRSAAVLIDSCMACIQQPSYSNCSVLIAILDWITSPSGPKHREGVHATMISLIGSIHVVGMQSVSHYRHSQIRSSSGTVQLFRGMKYDKIEITCSTKFHMYSSKSNQIWVTHDTVIEFCIKLKLFIDWCVSRRCLRIDAVHIFGRSQICRRIIELLHQSFENDIIAVARPACQTEFRAIKSNAAPAVFSIFWASLSPLLMPIGHQRQSIYCVFQELYKWIIFYFWIRTKHRTA